MLALHNLKINSTRILKILEDFEMFCLGKKILNPEQYRELNQELSIEAVLHIGKCKLIKKNDGKHVVWTSPDEHEHDLGTVNGMNVMRDYPGFHRSRSLSLGHTTVAENEIIDIPHQRQKISMVKLDDGTEGYGPNYRIALRNAALRRQLKKEFTRVNPPGIWKFIYGNA